MNFSYEWTFIAAILISVAIVTTNPPYVDPIHSLFLLTGAILIVFTFIASKWGKRPIGIKQMNVPAFLMQMSLSAVVLGIPVFIHPKAAAVITPISLTIGILAEETYRIAAFKYAVVAFDMPNLAVFMSGVVFAAMHMYWYPTEWALAIVGGMLFSATLGYFGSEMGAVGSHYMYDVLCFGFISIYLYFLIVIVAGIAGYGLRKVQPLER